jgi:folate-binding protein YgfZ
MTDDLTRDLEAGYQALCGEGARVELPRDLVTVVGPEAETFLQGQLSQDVAAIAPGTSRCSFLLQPTGKVDAWFRVGPVTDGFALDVAGGFGEAVRERLTRFKLRTKVDIELTPRGDVACAVRATRIGGGGPDISAPAVEGLAYTDAGDLPMVSFEAYDAVRIETGVPKMGAELTEATIPAEAGQWIVDQSVSFTKGCYTGQELVARIDSRGGNVPRHLRAVVIEGEAPPIGAMVVVDDTDVGALTSVAWSPGRAATVALAYVARKVEPPLDAHVTWDRGSARVRVEVLPLPTD